MRLAARSLGALVAPLLALAACGGGGPAVEPTAQIGDGGRSQAVLADQRLLLTVQAASRTYLGGRAGRVVAGGGSADAVATAVEHGERVDVVVLPDGPALDRVRDELLLPPEQIGRVDGTPFWVGAVTYRGMPFATFLAGRSAAAVLSAHGVDVPPEPTPAVRPT